ncbi:phosphotransferase family protein [Oceanibaculum nanhaiense]|uniref:phosphotransferase family protein n=1 Tax=Oceanibaculum nanhaiense TaxID=1909734 RepID=UPI003F6E5B37
MARLVDLSALHRALVRLPGYEQVPLGALAALPEKGLAHDHVRIAGTKALLRVPRQSQFAFSARDNLAYQKACFERCQPSGHTPALLGVLEPSDEVPMGALLVEHIAGVVLFLPGDMAGIAACLAAIHTLPLPLEADRPPLQEHREAVSGTLAIIERQTLGLAQAALDKEAADQIEKELAWARGFAAEVAQRPQPLALVLSDTHPGNYLRAASGQVVCVDLEKAVYGAPAIDLAHASLHTSTTWDVDAAASLSRGEIEAFYAAYLDLLPPAMRDALMPWLLPLRRLTWLRSVTWCVHYRVESAKARLRDKYQAASTEDWSSEDVDAALTAHVEGRVADYLDPATISAIRAEWLGPARLSF